jgi:hypothetical protein
MAVALFLAGATMMSASVLMGGIVVFVLGLALLGGSVATFLKCKPWENAENGGASR